MTILPGDPPVEILLRTSDRARRMTLRVSSLDGRVTLTRPASIREGDAIGFAAEKAAWLRAQLARTADTRWPVLGGTVPVGGVAHEIVPGRPGIADDRLRVRADRPVPPQVAAILKAEARTRFLAATDCHAGLLGRRVGRITLRDTRSRWGSCNHRGDLMFSWRLIMAPASVLDYVAAHEVAHLVHMDHSAAYWAVCERLCPGWRRERDWLRRYGGVLHAWRFNGPN